MIGLLALAAYAIILLALARLLLTAGPQLAFGSRAFELISID
jgi:hypothetical protein